MSATTKTTECSSAEKERPSAATNGGTKQNVTDGGCGPHDPTLYAYQHIAPSCSPTLLETVSDEIVQKYHQDGFLVFDQAFSTAVPELSRAMNALTHGDNTRFADNVRVQVNSGVPPTFTSGQQTAWAQYEAGTQVDAESLLTSGIADKVRKLMGFVGYEEAIDSIVQNSNLTQLVARLLGCQVDEMELFQSQALLKPAKGREKPWHQDNAYFDIGLETRVIGCWIAIDEATPENGCLRMATGMHVQGPRMHFAVRDYQICDEETSAFPIVAIALPPGGMVLFDGMIPHGTPTNMTDTGRRALQFHWVKKGAPRVGEKDPGGRAQVFGGAWNGLTC